MKDVRVINSLPRVIAFRDYLEAMIAGLVANALQLAVLDCADPVPSEGSTGSGFYVIVDETAKAVTRVGYRYIKNSSAILSLKTADVRVSYFSMGADIASFAGVLGKQVEEEVKAWQ